MNIITNIKCNKCNGAGKISHYKHVSGGLCFLCNGKGLKAVTINACDINATAACVENATVVANVFAALLAEVNAPRCPAA